jgi:sucrose-6-phosphate hydrolase SacC (GH32 family)
MRVRNAPILDRSEEDPYSLSYPFVIKVRDTYKMFYGSNRTWNTTKVDIDHILKSADSTDGIIWKNKEVVDIVFSQDANAFCRPSLLKANQNYFMAYAFRGSKYKIGFLKSQDLISWSQCGVFGPTPDVPWESEEVTYPYLFSMDEKTYMAYCGNSYGKFGIGLAEIDL